MVMMANRGSVLSRAAWAVLIFDIALAPGLRATKAGLAPAGQSHTVRLSAAWFFADHFANTWFAGFLGRHKAVVESEASGPSLLDLRRAVLRSGELAAPPGAQVRFGARAALSQDQRYFAANAIMRDTGGACTCIWAVSSHRFLRRIAYSGRVYNPLALSPHGSLLARPSGRGGVEIFGVRNGGRVRLLQLPRRIPQGQPIFALSFLSRSRCAAAIGSWVVCWNIGTGGVAFATRVGPKLQAFSLLSLKRGTNLAVGCAPMTILILKAADGRIRRRLTLETSDEHLQLRHAMQGLRWAEPWSLAACANGRILVASETSVNFHAGRGMQYVGRFVAVNIHSGAVVARSAPVLGAVYGVAVSHHGKRVLTTGTLGVRLWAVKPPLRGP